MHARQVACLNNCAQQVNCGRCLPGNLPLHKLASAYRSSCGYTVSKSVIAVCGGCLPGNLPRKLALFYSDL